ncbi:hypothetical protein L873DRAFT_1798869 [Choiromyces venosus 120613-1]|uniref:Tc1-like transposase DDE domain-containing protein n=1 Tax=Choiromyces venosus 120613-1 TaxID=1336337 RepID=A0A3N4K5U2_9PEZI|nr:hypothetical protein L873DRAFT_1798869 [Choiromyces venosus 120613-1]
MSVVRDLVELVLLKMVHQRFSTKCRKKNEVDILPCPPQSPDLNLIENIWGDMEAYLGRRYGRVASREELIRAMKEVWKAIHSGRFIDLCRSMPK